MKTIFDKVFYGEVSPRKAVVHDGTGKALRDEYLKARESFRQELPPEQGKKLSKLLLAHEDALAYEQDECFESGFCLGMMFMLEIVRQMNQMFPWDE